MHRVELDQSVSLEPMRAGHRRRMTPHNSIAALALATMLTACATTAGNQPAWVASTSHDPITEISRCVVSSPDRLGRYTLSRMGSLYPFVENNSELGLLVGVSSGGKMRIPPGDIVWRVDDNEYRSLKAAETPAIGDAPQLIDTSGMDDVMRQSVEASMASSAGMMSSIQNGITAIDGAGANEMLTEMRAGSELIYRSASASQSLGLTSNANLKVGRYTRDGLAPYPLDESFEVALQQCGL